MRRRRRGLSIIPRNPRQKYSPPNLAIFARPSAICTTCCPPHEPKRVEWIYIFFGSNRGRSLQYHSPRRLFSCPFVHPAGLLGVPAFSRSGRLNYPGTTHLDGPISFVYFLLGIGGVRVGVPTFIFSIILLWLPWCLGFALHYYTFLWRRVCDLFFWRELWLFTRGVSMYSVVAVVVTMWVGILYLSCTYYRVP